MTESKIKVNNFLEVKVYFKRQVNKSIIQT